MLNIDKNNSPPRWRAEYSVIEKRPTEIIGRNKEPHWKLKDCIEWRLMISKSLQILKYSGIRIPESAEQKLKNYSSVKAGYDINKDAVYLLLSYRKGLKGEQRWWRRYPTIVYSEGLNSRDPMEATEKAKNLLNDEKKLENILEKFNISGVTLGEIDGKPHIPRMKYNSALDGWVIK